MVPVALATLRYPSKIQLSPSLAQLVADLCGQAQRFLRTGVGVVQASDPRRHKSQSAKAIGLSGKIRRTPRAT